jgi:hypothetical protein
LGDSCEIPARKPLARPLHGASQGDPSCGRGTLTSAACTTRPTSCRQPEQTRRKRTVSMSPRRLAHVRGCLSHTHVHLTDLSSEQTRKRDNSHIVLDQIGQIPAVLYKNKQTNKFLLKLMSTQMIRVTCQCIGVSLLDLTSSAHASVTHTYASHRVERAEADLPPTLERKKIC